MQPTTRILIIEDEAQIRKNIAQLLTFNGFEVQAAANGREGLSMALLFQPDLVLCDVMMPEVDGYQVLSLLRENQSLAMVPFIFLTAKADPSDLRRGMELGADDYLTKPFAIADLLTAINSRLNREVQRKADLQLRLAEHHHQLSRISAHEYNTPLSGINGFADLLMTNYQDFDVAQRVSMLSMIKICGLRLKRSLDNVKRMDVLQELTPQHAAYPFFSTGQTQLTAEGVEKQLQLVGYRQSRTVPRQVDVEEAQLGISPENLQILLDEVLDNAVKFTEDDEPVRIYGQAEAAGYRLSISNWGRVFNAQDIAQIAPYVQFERQMYEQQGLGLGLSIVKKLVELNQGSLEITSQPAGETSVRVLLPRA